MISYKEKNSRFNDNNSRMTYTVYIYTIPLFFPNSSHESSKSSDFIQASKHFYTSIRFETMILDHEISN